MSKKIVSLALLLGFVTMLGACDQTGGGGTEGSPSPAETAPMESPSPSPS